MTSENSFTQKERISLLLSEYSLEMNTISLIRVNFYSLGVIFPLSKKWFWNKSFLSDLFLCLLNFRCVHLKDWIQSHSFESDKKFTLKIISHLVILKEWNVILFQSENSLHFLRVKFHFFECYCFHSYRKWTFHLFTLWEYEKC